MLNLIHQYHQAGFSLNQGASMQAIEAVTERLGCVLPESLLELYQDHDGVMPSEAWLPMRLMSLDKVAEFQSVVEETGWAEKGVRVFWTDDNSNYAGLHVKGVLEGKICLVDHEETDLSPVYASVPSFLTVVLAGADEELDWFELPRDYPRTAVLPDTQVTSQEWQVVQSLQPLYEAGQEGERTYYAFCMMALTPYEHTDSLLNLTYDEDMWIQERACEILGLRRYGPAVERLNEVAERGMPNGSMAAIQALGMIGSEAARAHLQKMLTTLPQGVLTYVKAALRNTK